MDPRIVHAVSFVYLKRVKTLSPANIIIRGLKNLVFVFSEKKWNRRDRGVFFLFFKTFLNITVFKLYKHLPEVIFVPKKITISQTVIFIFSLEHSVFIIYQQWCRCRIKPNQFYCKILYFLSFTIKTEIYSIVLYSIICIETMPFEKQ